MKIVIKIGTNVLLGKHAFEPSDNKILTTIVKQIALLHKQGENVILVTSGAVASGAAITGNQTLSRAACAAVGQAYLITRYLNLFASENIRIAQILLSPEVFTDRRRYEQFKITLQNLEKIRAIPIINENDVTACKTTFWDNDSLAAMVATLCDAQKLIFLTNVSGLYSAAPEEEKHKELIKAVENIGMSIQRMGSRKTSSWGTGGMLSKLKAAKLATNCGINTYIIHGRLSHGITDILLKNKKIGTHFLAKRKQPLGERKRWLFIGSLSKNKIVVDNGARKALANRKSLLAVGIVAISGAFKQGDFVNVSDTAGEIFAFGIVNYPSKNLAKLHASPKAYSTKKKFPKEVIHANNLALLF